MRTVSRRFRWTFFGASSKSKWKRPTPVRCVAVRAMTSAEPHGPALQPTGHAAGRSRRTAARASTSPRRPVPAPPPGLPSPLHRSNRPRGAGTCLEGFHEHPREGTTRRERAASQRGRAGRQPRRPAAGCSTRQPEHQLLRLSAGVLRGPRHAGLLHRPARLRPVPLRQRLLRLPGRPVVSRPPPPGTLPADRRLRGAADRARRELRRVPRRPVRRLRAWLVRPRRLSLRTCRLRRRQRLRTRRLRPRPRLPSRRRVAPAAAARRRRRPVARRSRRQQPGPERPVAARQRQRVLAGRRGGRPVAGPEPGRPRARRGAGGPGPRRRPRRLERRPEPVAGWTTASWPATCEGRERAQGGSDAALTASASGAQHRRRIDARNSGATTYDRGAPGGADRTGTAPCSRQLKHRWGWFVLGARHHVAGGDQPMRLLERTARWPRAALAVVVAVVGLGLLPLAAEARVNVDVNIYTGAAPGLALLPGTAVYSTDYYGYPVYRYQNVYYRDYGGTWYRSARYPLVWRTVSYRYVPVPVT